MPVLDTAPVSIRTSSQIPDPAAAKSGQSESENTSQAFDQQLEAEIKRSSPNNEPAGAEQSAIESAEDNPVEEKQVEVDVQVELVEQESLQQSVLLQAAEEEIPDLLEGNQLPPESIEAIALPLTTMTSQQGTSEKISLEQMVMSSQRQPQSQRPIQNLQAVVDPSVTEESAFKEADFADVLAQPTTKKPEVAVSQMQVENSLSRDMPELPRSVRGQGVQMTPVNLVNETSTKDLSSQLNQQLQLNTPVTQKSWGQEFSQRISMMITNGQQQVAELQLNPARMGSISVRVSLDDETANISFVTTQTAVKEAIEVSLPRLKEQLEQQGLDLGQVDVSSEDAEQAFEEDAGREVMTSADDAEAEMKQSEEINLFYQQNDGVSIFV